jgi:5'-nucleotidase
MPAGRVFGSDFIDDETEPELRIAFDFDGVIVNDSAEKVFREGQLEPGLFTRPELAG